MALDGLPDAIAAKPAGTDERLDRRQAAQWLAGAIGELPAADQQVLILHLEDLSYREIGEITGLSEGAIATRLSRIRDRLAEKARERGGNRP